MKLAQINHEKTHLAENIHHLDDPHHGDESQIIGGIAEYLDQLIQPKHTTTVNYNQGTITINVPELNWHIQCRIYRKSARITIASMAPHIIAHRNYDLADPTLFDQLQAFLDPTHTEYSQPDPNGPFPENLDQDLNE
jgi:hypothetical protein